MAGIVVSLQTLLTTTYYSPHPTSLLNLPLPAGKAAALALWGCRRSPRGTEQGAAALPAPYWSRLHWEEECCCWSCCWPADALRVQIKTRKDLVRLYVSIYAQQFWVKGSCQKWEQSRDHECTHQLKAGITGMRERGGINSETLS